MGSLAFDVLNCKINGVKYTFAAQSVTLPATGCTYIYATSGGYNTTPDIIARSATVLPLWKVTTISDAILGTVDLRTTGGVGNDNSVPGDATAMADGPTILRSGMYAPITANGGGYEVPFAFTLGDWGPNAQPTWYAGMRFYYRAHGTTPTKPTYGGEIEATGAIYIVAMLGGLAAGQTYDIGLAYVDTKKNVSAITWPSGLNYSSGFCAGSPPSTDPGSFSPTPGSAPTLPTSTTNNINLVPDSNFDFAPFNSSGIAGNDNGYWHFQLIDGVSFYICKGGGVGNDWQVNSGASGSARWGVSNVIQLNPGSTYTLSGYIDATHCTGSTMPQWVVCLPGSGASNTYGTPITHISGVSGSNGTYHTTFTAPGGGQVVVVGHTESCTISGGILVFAQPQIEYGSTFTGYKPGVAVNADGTQAHSASSDQTQSTIMSTAGPEGSFLASAAVARRNIAGNTTFNFIFNPSAALNTVGWMGWNPNPAYASFTRDTKWGGRFILTVTGLPNVGSAAWWTQTIAITVLPNTQYTFSGNYYCNSIGGTVGTQYSYVGAQVNLKPSSTSYSAPQLTTASGVLTPFSVTFTTGSSDTTATVLLLSLLASTSTPMTNSCAWSSLKLEFGSVSTPHSDDTSTALVTATHQQSAGTEGSYLGSSQLSARHFYGGNASDSGAMVDLSSRILYTRSPNALTATLNSAGSAPLSTFLNMQGSIPPYTTDLQFVAISPSGAAYVNYYICGAGGSGTVIHFYRSDGTSYTIAAVGSSSSPMSVSATNGTAVYFIVYIAQGVASGFTVTHSTTPFTAAQIQTAIGDGFLPILASVSTPVSFVAGGGGGSRSGCPEVDQLMPMRKSGKEIFAPARLLVPGDAVLGSDGRWKTLHKAEVRDAEIWEVALPNETIRVDASHLVMDSKLNWVNVKDLTRSHRLIDKGGNPMKPLAVRRVGRGQMMALSIDAPFAYVLGRTLSHNVKQT
jgi:hypothetical protein